MNSNAVSVVESSFPTSLTVSISEKVLSAIFVNPGLCKSECSSTISEKGARVLGDMIAKEILQNHPYKIWKGAKDGYWHSYLPNVSGTKKRKKIKRRERKDLEKVIVEFYLDSKRHSENMTVGELYLEWLDYKTIHTKSTGTMKRLSADWIKYYSKNEIAGKKLKEITELYLDEWLHTVIKKYGLNKKAFYNMSMPIRQMLEYAVKKGYILKSPLENVGINTRLFEADTKKNDATQVFSVDEVPLIYKELRRRYEIRPGNTAPLAVLLAFETGVRVGELVAIKYEDITSDFIHIQRQESKVYSANKDGTYKLAGFEVVNHTKSNAGDRMVYLTEEARKIIQEVVRKNEINGESCNSYLFVKNGERIKARAVVYQLDKCLEALAIEHRSIHKARKTFVSALIDAGVNINEIRKLVGHADVKTTYDSYCYNRYGEEETHRKIEQALHPDKKIADKEIKTDEKSEGITGNHKVIRFPKDKKHGKPGNSAAFRK